MITTNYTPLTHAQHFSIKGIKPHSYDINESFIAHSSLIGKNQTAITLHEYSQYDSVVNAKTHLYKFTTDQEIHLLKILPSVSEFAIEIITSSAHGIYRHTILDASSHESIQISDFIGHVTYLSLNHNFLFIALCIDDYIEVVHIETRKRIQLLKHEESVIQSNFHTYHNDLIDLRSLLISLSDDRTYKGTLLFAHFHIKFGIFNLNHAFTSLNFLFPILPV